MAKKKDKKARPRSTGEATRSTADGRGGGR